MRHIETRNSEGANGVATAHQAGKQVAYQWHLTRNIGSDRGGEVSFLVPGKQIPGKAHSQHEE